MIYTVTLFDIKGKAFGGYHFNPRYYQGIKGPLDAVEDARSIYNRSQPPGSKRLPLSEDYVITHQGER